MSSCESSSADSNWGEEDGMASESVIVYGGGDAAARADRWAAMAEDARRREAARAAAEHDSLALWDLTQSWLLNFGRKGGNLSAKTLARYRSCLVPPDHERGRPLAPDSALLAAWRHENLLHPARMAGTRWLRALERAGAKPATVQVMLSAGRALYAALRAAGATEADPFKDVHPAPDPVARHEKRAEYGPDEIRRLLAVAEGDERLLVLLGAYGGLRAAEMVALRWADVDLAGGRLAVARGKGGKRRTIPLAPALATALATALGGAGRTSVHVLTLAQERQTGGAATTRYRAASHRLARLCARAGLPKRGLHALRHSAGTRLYEQSGDVELVSRLLGHESIATSTIYIKKSDTKLAKALEAWGD